MFLVSNSHCPPAGGREGSKNRASQKTCQCKKTESTLSSIRASGKSGREISPSMTDGLNLPYYFKAYGLKTKFVTVCSLLRWNSKAQTS